MPYQPTARLEASKGTARIDARDRPEDELELRQLFSIVKRRIPLILLCTLACALLAALFAFTAARRFSATATIEVTQAANHDTGLDELAGGLAALSTSEMLNTELLTEQSEISSETVALDVIDKLKLIDSAPFAIPPDTRPNDPLYAEKGVPLSDAPHQRERVLRLFDANLVVALVKGTRLMTVTYSDRNPARAAQIANAVVEAYKDEAAKSRFNASTEISSGLTNQLYTLKQNVELSQKKVEEYQNQTGLVGTTSELPAKGEQAQTSPSVSVPVARLVALNDQLTRAQLSRIAMEAIYRTTQAKNPEADLGIPSSPLVAGPGAESSFSATANGLAELQLLRSQQAQLNVQIANTATRYGPKSSTMLDLRSKYAAVNTQIGAELNRISERAKSDLDLARLTESGIEKQVGVQEADVSHWSTRADHLMLLEGEAAASRQLYQDLYAKLQEANLAGGMKGSSVAVVNQARVPADPSSPKRKQDVALGIVAGLVLGLILAFALDYVDDTLHGRHEAQVILGGPLLGTLPITDKKDLRNSRPPWLIEGSVPSMLLSDGQSEIAEAYRVLRTALLANTTSSGPHTVAITSGSPHEGKAVTAFNLAISLALLKRRVLLLDADMHRLSNNDAAAPGLSDVLSRGTTPTQVIKPMPGVPCLYVLPAGRNPGSPAELLSSDTFGGLLQQLQSEYDHIIIDCPPALRFTDATVLARLSGTYIVVARAGSTSRGALRQTLEVLGHANAMLLGVVLTTADAKLPMSSRNAY